MKRVLPFLLLLFLVGNVLSIAVDSCSSLPEGQHELSREILATATPCLTITSNTVLDGKGFSLNATREHSALGMVVDGENVIVRNITLVNFEEGIHLRGRNITLEHVRVLGPSTVGEVGILVESSNTNLYDIQVLNYEVHIAFVEQNDTNLTKAVLTDYASFGLTPPESPPSLFAPAPLPGDDELERFGVSYTIDGPILTIEVLDEDGNPVSGALVLLAKFYSRSSYVIVSSTTTEDGIATLTLPSAGEYFFKVKKRGFYTYESERFLYEGTTRGLPPMQVLQPPSGGEEGEGVEGERDTVEEGAEEVEGVAEGGNAEEGSGGERVEGLGEEGTTLLLEEAEEVVAQEGGESGEGPTGGTGMGEGIMGLYEATVLPPSVEGSEGKGWQEGLCEGVKCYLLAALLLAGGGAVAYILQRANRRGQNPFKALQRRRR